MMKNSRSNTGTNSRKGKSYPNDACAVIRILNRDDSTITVHRYGVLFDSKEEHLLLTNDRFTSLIRAGILVSDNRVTKDYLVLNPKYIKK